MKRLLWTVVVALLLGAAALWGAGKLVWAQPPRTGELVWPTPLAVLAVAAVGAVLALNDIGRRILGFLLVIVGVAAGVLSFVDAELFGIGPLTGLLGGVLVGGAGLVLVVRGHTLPRLGAKYSAPAAKQNKRDADTELWNALSDGEDPTVSSDPGPGDPRPRG